MKWNRTGSGSPSVDLVGVQHGCSKTGGKADSREWLELQEKLFAHYSESDKVLLKGLQRMEDVTQVTLQQIRAWGGHAECLMGRRV